MSRYLIPSLSIEQLNALQNAIVSGAFNRQVRSLQLAIEANAGHSSTQDTFLKELDYLREAARAIMNAAPLHQTPEGKALQAVNNLCAIHHVYGYNTKAFQDAYVHAAKEVNYNWELLVSDLPAWVADRGRSLT